MKHLLENYKSHKIKTKAPHELSDMTNLVEKKLGFVRGYGRGFWLKLLKINGCSYFSLDKLIEKSGELHEKYNKSGWVVNQLTNKRTVKSPNEIVDYKDYIEIVLYNKNCEKVAVTKVDKSLREKIKKYKWGLSYPKKYACSTILKTNKHIYLHRLVLPPKDGLITDHINGDKLDNRLKNLRYATIKQNLMNSVKPKGVYKRNYGRNVMWSAYIGLNGKTINLGQFNTEKEALEVRHNAEKKYFGEFAPNREEFLNKPK